MAKINFTPQFKRAYKKLNRKHYDTNKLKHVVTLLVEEKFEILAQKYKIAYKISDQEKKLFDKIIDLNKYTKRYSNTI